MNYFNHNGLQLRDLCAFARGFFSQQTLTYIVGIALFLGGSNLCATEAQIDTFVKRMVETHGFERTEIESILAKAKKNQVILDKISKPAERTLNWTQYSKIFLTDKRMDAGVAFWKRNEAALERAEKEYGVPAKIIVAIIGVETFYGRITGKDKVLDALYTLGFYYPKRSKFFVRELEEFLLLAREENLDPTQPKGSYAGAMGLGQFMPDSYRAYAVDFDGDGKRDIWNNETDAIGSVANYFAKHHWKSGKPVTRPARNVTQDHQKFAQAGMKPSINIAAMRTAGISTGDDLPGDMLSSLVELKTDAGNEYWLGLPNFYVITRYNHSNMYAMAVFQLGKWIQARKSDLSE